MQFATKPRRTRHGDDNAAFRPTRVAPILATGMLAVLVTALAIPRHAGRTGEPGAPPARPAGAAAAPGAAWAPVAGGSAIRGGAASGGQSSGGSSGAPSAITPDLLDSIFSLALRSLDPSRERDVYGLLERVNARLSPPGPQNVELITASLRRLRGHEDPLVRCGALAALARLPEGGAGTESFVASFDDPDPRVRERAVRGRARQGLARYCKSVLRLARDPDARVRVAIADALGEVTDPGAHAALADLLTDRDDAVVDAAAQALARQVTPAPDEQVLRAARSDRPHVRMAAAVVLGATHTPACLTPLAALTDDDAFPVRRAAIRGLAAFRGPGAAGATLRVGAIADCVTRVRPDRFEALQALAHTGTQPELSGTAAVAAGEEDPVLRLAAARTLLARNDPRACSALAELVATTTGPNCDGAQSRFVRANALDTLRRVTGAPALDDDVEAWRRLVPGFESAVRAGQIAYRPEDLVLFR